MVEALERKCECGDSGATVSYAHLVTSQFSHFKVGIKTVPNCQVIYKLFLTDFIFSSKVTPLAFKLLCKLKRQNIVTESTNTLDTDI